MTRYLALAALCALMILGLGSTTVADNPAAWGEVTGQVVYGGDSIPELKKLEVTKDQEHCLGMGPILSEEWVVNPKNKGVRWVFVWLGPADPKSKVKLPIHPDLKDLKDKSVILDQPTCQFIPHALALREGQVLVTMNSAKIAHNVHWTGFPTKNPGGNVIVPPGGKHEVTDLRADTRPIKVVCDIHGWMNANLRVYDHPYFALTDANGNFTIPKAPVGDYRITVWHEGAGWGPGGRDGKPITIAAGKATDAGKIEIKKE
jgi:hypothetical protein